MCCMDEDGLRQEVARLKLELEKKEKELNQPQNIYFVKPMFVCYYCVVTACASYARALTRGSSPVVTNVKCTW